MYVFESLIIYFVKEKTFYYDYWYLMYKDLHTKDRKVEGCNSRRNWFTLIGKPFGDVIPDCSQNFIRTFNRRSEI